MLLLTGPSGSGKSARVFARFREAVREGRSDFRLVAPTATLVEHLRNQCAREGLVFRPELITTLSKLAGTLAPRAQQISRPMFVEQASACCSVFPGLADAPNFPATVAQTIEWLDSLGCSSEALLRLPTSEAPFAAPLAAVWTALSANLTTRNLHTRTGLLRQAAATPTVPFQHLWFDGFRAFSDPELHLISAVSRQADVTITLPDDPAAAVTTSRLLALGATHQALPSPTPHPPEIQHFAATSIEREAEEIARRILAHGEPLREIGVALRNPDRYTAILQATFERFGIPARFYFASPLIENPAARFLTATVDALLGGWDHAQCLDALRLLPPAPSLDSLDFAIRKQLPERGLDALQALQPREPAKTLIAQWARIDPWRERRLAPHDWANALASLTALFPPTSAALAIQRAQSAALALWPAAMEEAASWWLDTNAPIALADFWRTAKSIVRMTPLRVPDKRRNVVHVMSLHEAREWDLDVIFVCGMAEKEFPRRHPRNAFLPDAAVGRLQQSGFRVPTAAERDAEEETLFLAVQTAAREQLICSYAAGGQSLPSVFFTPAAELEPCVAVQPEARPAPHKGKLSGVIRSADLFPILQRKTEKLSVTGLESYLQCAFQFFASRTLKLRLPPERPEERLSSLTQGNIVHEVLARWYTGRPNIEDLFEEVFRRKCQELRIPPSYRREMLREQMRADLVRFAADDRWPRGNQADTEKELTIHLSETAIIGAKIDRLETLPDGSKVIVDYKYSNATNTRGKVDDETKLQGPLYVHGVQADERVSAMVYYSLRRDSNNVQPKPFGWGDVPGLKANLEPLTKEWLDRGVSAALEAVVGLRSGRIVPVPANGDNCRFCDFLDACRYEAQAALAAGG